MSIRFKTELFCGRVAGESYSTCHLIQVPIRDWELAPENISINYELGSPYPSNRMLVVTYPELWELEDYEDTSDFRFAILIEYGSIEFFDIVTDQTDPNNIELDEDGKAFFEIRWKNLHQLPPNVTSVTIKHQAFGVRDGVEEFLEEVVQSINLKRIGEGSGSLEVDKEVYQILYNIDDDTWIGDNRIFIANSQANIPIEDFQITSDSDIGFEIAGTSDSRVYYINRMVDTPTIYDTSGAHHSYHVDLYNGTELADSFVIEVIVTGISHQSIVSNYSVDYNFAKDNIWFEVSKSDSAVDRLQMELNMTFQINGKDPETFTETYEYLFINDKIRLYPGDEIHDFFHRLQRHFTNESIIQQGSIFNTIVPSAIFAMAKVDIKITEFDSTWEEYNVHNALNTFWIPGKRPLAFPYLTNGRLRSTYNESLVSICALQQHFIEQELHKLASPFVNNNTVNSKQNWIVQASFRRSTSNANFGANEIIRHKALSLEPIPNPKNVYHVIFENQNLCPDWFSFCEEYEIEPDLNHKLTARLSGGNKFKANVEKDKILKLNTGWVLEEEIDLLTELIESGICYVQLKKGQWITCIPISKKPLKYDTSTNLHQQIVEFEIIDNNER